jgi:hypothetical protein
MKRSLVQSKFYYTGKPRYVIWIARFAELLALNQTFRSSWTSIVAVDANVFG